MRVFVVLSMFAGFAFAAPGYHSAPAYGYHGPAAPLAHDGTVIDTPEVAHAKAAHLQAHAEAAARASYGGHGGYADGGYDDVHQGVYTTGVSHGAYGHGYHGPAAPLAHDGRVVDTPEVAHARAAHLAAHAHEASRGGHYDGYDDGSSYEGGYAGHGYAAAPVQVVYAHAAPVGYHGPPAPLSHDGRVVDTPEVAHAKAAHLQAHAHAAAQASHYAPAPESGYEHGHYY